MAKSKIIIRILKINVLIYRVINNKTGNKDGFSINSLTSFEALRCNFKIEMISIKFQGNVSNKKNISNFLGLILESCNDKIKYDRYFLRKTRFCVLTPLSQ